VNENVKIVVDNIKIFIEMLRIQKQTVQNLHSEGSTQILSDIHTSIQNKQHIYQKALIEIHF